MHDSDLSHRLKVIALLDASLSLSLILIAATRGQKLKPFLAEMTGLSDTRISQGNLDKLSAARQRRIDRHVRQQVIDEGRRYGQSPEQVDANMAALRTLNLGPWEVFALILMAREIDKIPHSLSIGRAYGNHLSALLADAQAGNLASFRSRLSPHSLAELAPHDEYLLPDALEKYRQEFELAQNWEALLPLLGKIIEFWLWDFFAAMDAEWGLCYFHGMAPQPYFLWVAPKTPLVIQEPIEIRSKRNIVYHPVRRLLEFSHALMARAVSRQWPDQPVGRKKLGRDSDTDEALIGGYFDGTKLMRVKDFEHLWYQVYRQMSGRSEIADCPAEPMALVHAALLFQRLLVRSGATKSEKSFVILDEAIYRTNWARHLGVVSGQPKAGVVDWPEWLVNQRLAATTEVGQSV